MPSARRWGGRSTHRCGPSDPTQTREQLLELTRLSTRLAELQLRVAHHAASIGAGEDTGATSTAAWWAHETRQLPGAVHGLTRLAKHLDAHPVTRQATERGEVLLEQARVILTALDALPEDPAVREQCEKHLLEQAAHFTAKELRILGRRVLEVVDPDAAEAHEAKLLDDEERRAAQAVSFSMRRDGTGIVRGWFALSEMHAAMLEKSLRAIAAPKHQRAAHGAGGYDPGRPSKQRMGEAFGEYIERYRVEDLPNTGGVNATVVVTMDLATLLGSVRTAQLDTGEQITAATARRLACEAGLVPAVLDGRSHVLDLGRRNRLHSPAQRLALALSQCHCQGPACDVPAAFCHVHHTIPWTRGGPTDLANAQLLCHRHHTLAHRGSPEPHRRE